MKNKNLHLAEFYQSFFREKRFVYGDNMDKLEEAGAAALTAVADILGAGADAIKWGIDMAKVGVYLTGEGVKKAWETVSDPGEPNWLLDDYLEKHNDPDFAFEAISNTQLNQALEAHSHLLFLNFKTEQYLELMEPAVNELKTVSESVKEIRSNIRAFDDEIESRKDRIKAIDKIFVEQHISKETTHGVDLMSEKAELQSELLEYERLCSFKVEWAKPEYQTVEFPPGSRNMRKRFVRSGTEKVQIRLDKYEEWLLRELSRYKSELEKVSFKEEKEKMAYYREASIKKFLQSAGAFSATDMAVFEARKSALEAKVKAKKIEFPATKTEPVNFPGVIVHGPGSKSRFEAPPVSPDIFKDL